MTVALKLVAALSALLFSANAANGAPAFSGQQAVSKPVVRSVGDLPRHSYPFQGKLSRLISDDAVMLPLLMQVRADTEATLGNYDITDRATLRRLHMILRNIALLTSDMETAEAQVAVLRTLQDKEADRLLSGLYWTAYFSALQTAEAGSPIFRERFREAYAALMYPLPYEIVADDVRADAGWQEASSAAQVLAGLDRDFQPIVDRGGTISDDMVPALVGSMLSLRIVQPLNPDSLAVEFAYLDRNDAPKPDIWAARAARFPENSRLTPVIVAVWDSGVDASLFPDRLWVNAGEVVDGRDNDANGYIDDIHGIAFDENQAPSLSSLVAVPEAIVPRLARISAVAQGISDQSAGIRSAAATSVRDALAAATAAQSDQLFSDLAFYSEYSHGTGVASIAVADNPAARLMIVRATSDWRSPAPKPTTELAERYASLHRNVVDYMKANSVRVVNISWGTSLEVYERALEAHGVPVEERTAEARRLFAIESTSLRGAIESAPEILFVVGAGNSNDSASFTGSIPASFEFDNVLTVAAVDQAGNPTSFTSGGPTVDLAANGFRVESFVPGGQRQALSGTSFAAPQITNLAVSLLAMKPNLTVAELRALIVETATVTSDGYRLIHPGEAFRSAQVAD